MPKSTRPNALLKRLVALPFLLASALLAGPYSVAQKKLHVLPKEKLAQEYFGADASWFVADIPFLEIDDPEIQKVYYYRWKLYRAHIREIGAQGTDETEFLDDVPWARHPYTDLNDSSSFHIMEGRWLRNPVYVTSLVDHLYTGGGNDRHFSESIAAATYAWTKVTGDPAPALRHLDAMQHIYNLWDDHFDAARNLYWIEPLLDATEYTISSIDASGAGFTDTPSKRDDQNGFTGGFAFRPSINAYQFANAEAIASLARVAGRPGIANEYTRRAEALRQATLAQLWNPNLRHFTDIYQRSTPFVKAGDFIRGRELVGYAPWVVDLPPRSPSSTRDPDYPAAWHHALDPAELGGARGFRTVEPSYPRYLQQYRYDRATGLPECQWNGPSWPFQTSQTLTAMANLLDDYDQHTVTAADYVHLLRQYTQQHLLSSGTPDLQEDYNPDTGAPIVGLPRSHHYNHSTYNDLILSGLIGIRPHAGDMLEINPLLPPSNSSERPIRYFALEGLRYHGHDLTLIYDADGSRYHFGAGLSIFSDGLRITGPAPLHRTLVHLPLGRPTPLRHRIDIAVNAWGRVPFPFETDLPIASASSTAEDSHLYEAIDGRLWFFPEIGNGWSPDTADRNSWFSIDLRHPTRTDRAEVYFFSDGKLYLPPAGYRLQMLSGGTWKDVPTQHRSPTVPLANGANEIAFPPVSASHFRVILAPQAKPARLRLVEFELIATPSSH
jgi:hypothetical protein